MKLTFICLLVLCLIGAAPNPSPGAKARPTVGKVGRFRLHNHTDTIYKIDTTTGETWFLVKMVGAPNNIPSWVRLPHYIEHATQDPNSPEVVPGTAPLTK